MNEHAITLRSLLQADAAASVAVYAEALASGGVGTPWSVAAVLSTLRETGGFGVLAETDRAQPVGVALVRVAADEAELLALGVVPAGRRRGIARRLLATALRQAGERGARRMLLEVAETNAGARRLYAGAGFTVCGRRRRYYGTVDALTLERPLEPA